MRFEPAIVDVADREWESWPAELTEQRGCVRWKTLLSGDLTSSDTLTLGIAMLPPGGVLREHRHAQAELYLVLEGAGVVTVGEAVRPVAAGTAVFIPGNTAHAIRNDGDRELRFAYVLAADSFADVEYLFDPA